MLVASGTSASRSTFLNGMLEATPKITSEDGQTIRVVNTKGTGSHAKVSAGDSCSTTGLLTEGAAGNALLTSADGNWRNLRVLDQAPFK